MNTLPSTKRAQSAEALHAEGAEQGALGCVLLSPECLPELIKSLPGPEAFYDLRHRTVYETILGMHAAGEQIDTIGLYQRLKDRGLLEAVGGIGYLSALPHVVPSAANLPVYLKLLNEKFATRQVLQTAHDVIEAVELGGRVDTLATYAARAFGFIQAGSQPCLPARSLCELRRSDNDNTELLRHRYLCRGGGLLLCGPTGIGKSSLSMQAMLLWALGREAFGIAPAGPLKSLLIQAENDDGDLAEMRDGVIAGLGLSEADAAAATANITVIREDEHTAMRFFEKTVRPLLAAHRPDLLWIDPALSYLGGEVSSQREVGAFLRNGLNPLLAEFNCGGIVVHHTNKPASGQEKKTWSGADFAYLGSGSAEWANWARAVLALRSIGSQEVYELRAAKRGTRLEWREADGTRSFARYVAHAKEAGLICWQEVEAPDLPEAGSGRAPEYDINDVLALLPPEGLKTSDWQERAGQDLGLSRASFHRAVKSLQNSGRVWKSDFFGKWQPRDAMANASSEKSHVEQAPAPETLRH